MLKENQLSTILLLALVGFVIYQLMQPTTIKNKGTVEESEETSEVQERPQVVGNGDETVMEMIPEEIESSEEQPEVESESEEELENDGVEVLDDRLLEEKQSDPVNKNSKDQNREFPEVIYLSTQNMKVTQSNTIMRRVKD